MITRNRMIPIVICIVVSIALLQQAALADLPPRPTPESPTRPAGRGPDGGFIALQAHFPSSWPWSTVHWQSLWTVVQWQDEHGVWHDVEGWQGEFDDVATEDSTVVGQKVWWVARRDLGTGPFRWRVYQGKGGRLLGTSAPFDLPAAVGTTVTVEVDLVS